MEVLQKHNELDCNRCSFHGADYKSVQIHMGTIHPEFCEEIDTGGLGKLVFYQKSARLFHCHRCFFTSKMFSNVYNHILGQHSSPDKVIHKTKPVVEPKLEQVLLPSSEKNDSESMVSEDDKSVEEKFKLKEVKSEENDTLTSWPENVPCQVTQDNSDVEFKSSSSSEKTRTVFPDTKDSSCDPESSSSSDNVSTEKSGQANVGVEFSDNDVASSISKDIPEFSDEDDEPALPGGIPHFSDEETIIPSKDVQESSEDDVLPDHSRGIEDISEDEMPLDEKRVENTSEDESAPPQSKPEDSSEDDDLSAPPKEMMEFSDDEEEDNIALSKDDMDFSEEEDDEASNKPTKVETPNVSKNVMDFSEEEETTNASRNVMEFLEEEETTNASRNIMEFSEEEETPGLSKEIMEFSDDDDDDTAPAMSKSLMEFSEEEDISPQSKNMPKYLEGNSTPTQSKDFDYAEDVDTSLLKGSSPFSEDGTPDECPIRPKDLVDKSKSLTPNIAQLSGTTHFPEYASTPSWSKDGLETSDSGDVSLSAPDNLDVSDDKDGFVRDEEILKHVKRVKGRYHCMLCECRPLKKGPVMHHLITRHNMPSPFVCKTCGKTFVVETHLKLHLSSHSKGLFKCHRCNFQTDHPRGFKKHQTHCDSRHKEEASKPVVDFQEGDQEEPELP